MEYSFLILLKKYMYPNPTTGREGATLKYNKQRQIYFFFSRNVTDPFRLPGDNNLNYDRLAPKKAAMVILSCYNDL